MRKERNGALMMDAGGIGVKDAMQLRIAGQQAAEQHQRDHRASPSATGGGTAQEAKLFANCLQNICNKPRMPF